MIKNFKITEFNSDAFLHSRIKDVVFNAQKKFLSINLHAADLKNGQYITSCCIKISDWLNFEVVEKGSKIFKNYSENEIPTDIEQIFKFEREVQ